MIALPAGDLTDKVGQYVTEKVGGMELAPGTFQAFMVKNDQNEFVAGITISNFRKTDCEISVASETPTWCRPHVCKAIFIYVFEQLGCVRVTSITVKGNKKARGLLESLGFQLEGNVRLGYDGKRDALIYGLLRSECRFLGEEGTLNGQEIGASGSSSAGPDSDGERTGGGKQGRGDNASELEPDRPSNATGEPLVLH